MGRPKDIRSQPVAGGEGNLKKAAKPMRDQVLDEIIDHRLSAIRQQGVFQGRTN